MQQELKTKTFVLGIDIQSEMRNGHVRKGVHTGNLFERGGGK